MKPEPVIVEVLRAQLARLRVGLFRPDLGILQGKAVLATVERMEAARVLVPVGGALMYANHEDPVCAALYEAGVIPAAIAQLGYDRRDRS